MTSYRGIRPRLDWGTAYANSVEFGYPFDDPRSNSADREGSEAVQLVSGIEDASQAGQDFTLAALARWVPGESEYTTRGVYATGWDGATGMDAARHWLRGKRLGRLYPDGRNLAPNPGIAGTLASTPTAMGVGSGNTVLCSVDVADHDGTAYVAKHTRNGVASPTDTNIGTQSSRNIGSGVAICGRVDVYIPTACSLTSLTLAFESGVTGATTGTANLATRDTWQSLLCTATTSSAGARSLVLRQASASNGQVIYSDAWQVTMGATQLSYIAPSYFSVYLQPTEEPTPEKNGTKSVPWLFRSTSAFTGY